MFCGRWRGFARHPLFCASIAAQQSPAPQPLSIEGAAAHVYKTVSGTELRLHVFSPRHGTSKSMPAVIFFFGGGWHSDTLQEMDAFLTRLGYLTAGSPHATDARPRLLPRPQASVDHRATSQPSRM